jgi:signal transduction histidine kinase
MNGTGETTVQLEQELKWLRARVAELESHEAEWTRAREEQAREHGERGMEQEMERRRLRTILDMLPVGVFIAEANGRIVESNAAARAIWGEGVPLVNTVAEYSAYRGWRLPSGAEMTVEEWPLARAVTRGEVSVGEEIEIEVEDGSRRVILDSAVPLRDEHGEITGAVNVHVDITALTQAEEDIRQLNSELERRVAERTAQLEVASRATDDALARERAAREEAESARAFLTTVLDQAPAIIFTLEGPEHVCRYMNPFGLRLLAPTGIDPRGRKLEEALPGLREQGLIALLDRVYHSGETIVHPETLYRYKRPNGENTDTWWDFVFVPWRDANGNIAGVIVLGPEVTERVRQQTERQRLEEQKDEFLSIASHELKTPLTSLKGRVQFALRQLESSGTVPAANLRWMALSVERMERLVNDLVDSARVDADRLALRRERRDLVELCRGVAEEQSDVSSRVITLQLPDERIELQLDSERFTQVVTNLLSNALKYSPEPEPIVLGVSRTDSEAIMFVRDNGPGIPPDAVPHLFERFYRVPGIEARSSSEEGLGLGLYICHKIVEQHGGRIWCESVQGHGATFFVALPMP